MPEFLPEYTSTARKQGGPLGFRPQMPPWDIVAVSGTKGSFRVGLLGLLTSERGIFRTDRMRGLNIQPVIPSAQKWAAQLRAEMGVSHVIALTHQSIAADEALSLSGCVDLILGGHEHEVMEVRPEGGCPIIKSGSDAKIAAVVQLWLGADRAVDVQVAFEEVAKYSADRELEVEVDSHHAVSKDAGYPIYRPLCLCLTNTYHATDPSLEEVAEYRTDREHGILKSYTPRPLILPELSRPKDLTPLILIFLPLRCCAPSSPSQCAHWRILLFRKRPALPSTPSPRPSLPYPSGAPHQSSPTPSLTPYSPISSLRCSEPSSLSQCALWKILPFSKRLALLYPPSARASSRLQSALSLPRVYEIAWARR